MSSEECQIAEVQSRCRICMAEKSSQISLFEYDRFNKIQEVASVQVAIGDGLPSTICIDCEVNLEKCYEFRAQVQNADKKFREEISMSQILIECNVKEEGRFELEDDNEENDDSYYGHDNDDSPEASHDGSIAEQRDNNHEDIVDNGRNAGVEVPNDPSEQEDPLIEMGTQLEQSEDPLTSMKVEQFEPMETDSNVAGPSTATAAATTSTSNVRGPEPAASLPKRPVSSNRPIKEREMKSVKLLQPKRFVKGQKLPPNTVLTVEPVSDLTVSTRTSKRKQSLGILENKSTLDVEPNEEKTEENSDPGDGAESSVDEIISDTESKEDSTVSESFCTICYKDFWTVELLKKHLEENSFTCRICTEGFESHIDLSRHFIRHQSYKCKVCKKLFYSRKDVYYHRKKSKKCNPNSVCEFCNKKCMNEVVLRLHVKNFHSSESRMKNYSCVVCKKRFTFLHILNQHLRNSHIANEFVECRICQTLCLGPDRLKTHMKNSHIDRKDQELFTCQTCYKVFNRLSTWRNHQQTHVVKISLCDICGKPFKGKGLMQRHVKYEHSNTGVFSCKPCDKHFNTEIKLRKHLQSSTKHRVLPRVCCDVCGKTLRDSKVLKEHMKIHSGERPYKCELCGATFRQETALKTHSRVHSGVCKYQCSSCNMSFKWKQTFDNHVKKCKATV